MIPTSLWSADNTKGVDRVWQKYFQAPSSDFTQYDARLYGSSTIIVAHNIGFTGVHIMRVSDIGDKIAELTSWSADTTAFIDNAGIPVVQPNGEIRFYGTECYFNSIPPLHLSKLTSKYRPMFFDCDSSLRILRKFYYGTRDSTCRFPLVLTDVHTPSDLVYQTNSGDSIRVDSYDSDLQRRKQICNIGPNNGRIFGISNVYKLGTDTTLIGVYFEPDFSTAFYKFFTVFNGRIIDSTRLYYRISTQMFMLRPDSLIIGSVMYRDTTYELNLNVFDRHAKLLCVKKVVPEISVNPTQFLHASDGGIYVVGSARQPRDFVSDDNHRQAFICKLDRNLDVQWYDMTGRDTTADVYSTLQELPDSTVLAIGWSAANGHQRTIITKYKPRRNVQSSVEESQSISEMTLSPNPVTNVIHVSVSLQDEDDLREGTVEIYNTLGVLVKRSRIGGYMGSNERSRNTLTIPCDDLNAGAFVLRVRGTNSVQDYRFNRVSE